MVHTDPTKRHDYVCFIDILNGNANGDPDFDNSPRCDPETQTALMTDGCMKRKFRKYIDITRGWEPPYRIYVQNRGYALNDLHREAYDDLKIRVVGSRIRRDDEDKIREWMCRNYWDIRMFGAAMSTKVSAGVVTGPMQITFMASVDPVVPVPVTITRVAVTRTEDMKKSGRDEEEGGDGKRSEMGRKYILPYAMFKGYGFFSPHMARRTGVTGDDLALFWEAVLNCLEHDRSSSRGFMAVRGVYIFSHDNPRGNAPAHKLLERVKVARKEGVQFARSFEDYELQVDNHLPDGVTLTVLGV